MATMRWGQLWRWLRRTTLWTRAWLAMLLLFVVSALVCVPSYRQWRAISKLEGRGFRMQFNTPNASPWDLTASWRRYRWVNRLYANFQTATRVVDTARMADTPIEDSDFDYLHSIRFNSETYFDFEQSQLNNHHMKRFEEFPDIRYLSLRRTRLRDVGLVHLRPLKHLKWLNVGSTRITDEGLDEIVKLQELEVLWIDHTDVTVEGLKKLKALPKLRRLVQDVCKDSKYLAEILPNCKQSD